ncbi:hypothetical protein MNV49_004010 [Pseudohyphozyma bogoriensis]|nr:hypothetical protein MNV49_004010 [Pseudohyphozyma bogoriensis]
MATLERDRERERPRLDDDDAPPAFTSPFDPAAVPREPVDLRPQWQQIEADDLISLGEEQLFTGTRTRAAPTAWTSAREEARVSSGPSSPVVVSEELFKSLGAAKHAFVFALKSLLQQQFDESRLATPPSEPVTTNPFLSSQPIPSTSDTLNPFAPSTAEPDEVLATLVRNLRLQPHHSSGVPTPPMRSLGGSPLLGSASPKEALVDELQSRLDVLAADLPPVDAELARSLGSLLGCIERLLTISRRHTGNSPIPPHVPSEGRASPNVYLTLEREARALQSAKEEDVEADAVVGAAREVEIAERDLLWGRVDDLSERVGLLSRQRAAQAAAAAVHEPVSSANGVTVADDVGSPSSEHWKEAEAREESLYEHSLSGDLPQYSTDAAHLPPAYISDHHPEHTLDSKSNDWEKPPLSPDGRLHSPGARTRPRRVSTSGKTERDLESVSIAIERLYAVSPQLSNQRVEPDRRQLRERQLAKLGNAIERLAKGRLDNQRAAASPVIPEEPEEKAQRIKRVHEAQLDKLIEQIDRAASRTLADQRVDMNGKRKALNRLSLADSDELERRHFIMNHTGKGRLASQDATFNNGLVERFPRAPSPTRPVTISEFFRQPQVEDARASSFPSRPVIKKRFSGLFQGKLDDETSENPSASSSGLNKKSLRLGVFKKGSTPSTSRRGSYDSRVDALYSGLGLTGSGMSRSSSVGLDVHSTSPLDYVCEESRNLGSIIITFWPRVPSSAKEEWEVLSVEAESILVASTKGGPATRLTLPCRAISQAVNIVSHGSFFEAKVVTIPPSPTRARPDLEIHAPLSTAELREHLPRAFSCTTCRTELVDSSTIEKYNALPSEHWAELLDAWMCHQDQTLSEDLVSKGKGIKPRQNEGLVASAYVVFGRELTKNWVTPEGSKPTRTEADDLLYPAHCASCLSLIGHHVKPMAEAPSPSCLRLIKYATFPSSPAGPSSATSTPRSNGSPVPPSSTSVLRYSLAAHLTSEMLEIGQAHACHRFLVEDAEDEKVRVLLWLFNPAIRVSFLNILPSSALFEDEWRAPSPDFSGNPGARPTSRTMNAVKVFYSVVADETDSKCQEFMSSDHAAPERITYPLAVISKLVDLLKASTAVYPVGKRTWGDMDAGFLERI